MKSLGKAKSWISEHPEVTQKFKITSQTQFDTRNDFWDTLVTRLIFVWFKKFESDRIESDRNAIYRSESDWTDLQRFNSIANAWKLILRLKLLKSNLNTNLTSLEIGVTFENCQFWSEWFQTWHRWTWRVNLPLLKGPTLIKAKKFENIAFYWNKWNYFVRDSKNHSKAKAKWKF